MYFIASDTTEKKKERYVKLKDILEAKPYVPEGKEAVDASEAMVEACDFDPESCCDVDDDNTDAKKKPDDICFICKQSFAVGQSVYQSNNPLCGHFQHQVRAKALLVLHFWIHYYLDLSRIILILWLSFTIL
mgnify:CR=1 FL=1